MARNTVWNDDYWLLLLQQYLRKPVGTKPLYDRAMVDLSLELHIAPQSLQARMQQIERQPTPWLSHLLRLYSKRPSRLDRAVALIRQMSGFGAEADFYDGVEIRETFEKFFRPLEEDSRLTPMMLVIILDLYFQLTPSTMVSQTPEVQQLARLMKTPAELVVDVLNVYQYCDPYMKRENIFFSPLLVPCQQAWTRYGDSDTNQLNALAEELKDYFR